MVCKHCNNTIPEGSYFCPYCGKKIASNIEKRIPFAVVLCFGLFIIMICVCKISQLDTQVEEQKSKISSLKEENDELNSEVQRQQTAIAQQNQEISSLRVTAGYWEDLGDLSGTFGYASSKFHLNTGIVVLAAGENEKVTLTEDYSGSTTIHHSTTGSAAEIKFDKSQWTGSTVTITVTANQAGSSVVNFSNSSSSEAFNLLIIVTEQ